MLVGVSDFGMLGPRDNPSQKLVSPRHNPERSRLIYACFPPQETKKQVRTLKHLLLLFHAVLAATTIFAGLVYYYNPRYTALPEEEVQQEKPDFEFGLFDGLGNMRVCCFSIWCLPIRWADTAARLTAVGQ